MEELKNEKRKDRRLQVILTLVTGLIGIGVGIFQTYFSNQGAGDIIKIQNTTNLENPTSESRLDSEIQVKKKQSNTKPSPIAGSPINSDSKPTKTESIVTGPKSETYSIEISGNNPSLIKMVHADCAGTLIKKGYKIIKQQSGAFYKLTISLEEDQNVSIQTGLINLACNFSWELTTHLGEIINSGSSREGVPAFSQEQGYKSLSKIIVEDIMKKL